LNEIGRESGNIARTSHGRPLNNLCDAENRFAGRRLVPVARLLCCADLDAAMHNRNPGDSPRESDSIFESNRRSIKPKQLMLACAVVLSDLVH
jgi:hypothetical protein